MTSNEFWMSVLSNSLATLIAGTILGSIIAIIIASISSANEKKSFEFEKNITKAKKKLDFLETLKLEFEDIVVHQQIIKDKFKNISSLPYIKFDISYWEILKTSGEIPSLFEPTIIQIFTNFYYRVSKCNLIYEQLLMAENSNHADNIRILFHEMENSLHSLEIYAEGSIGIELILKQVIEKTNENIARLEGQQKKSKKPSEPDNV